MLGGKKDPKGGAAAAGKGAKPAASEKGAGKEEKKDAKPAEDKGKDRIYYYDQEHVQTLNQEKPWLKNVKFFNKCNISALAAMKMLKHALAGVKKGRQGEGGQPVEVMGLLVGKPEGDTIVVMDVCPLPVEGIEYKVEAADQAQGFMIKLMESLELKRKERFVGWYHSHPFDVDVKPHYFLSSMDVSTQTLWQNSIATWTAIVIDPLRSLAKQEPQLGAFRVYPANHNPPKNEGPDGLIYPDEKVMNTRWGASARRYYQMQTSYFMSSLGNKMLDIMSRNNLWVRVLSSSSIMEPETRLRFAERVNKANEKLQGASQGGFQGVARRGGNAPKENTLTEGATACVELAIEQCNGHCSQVTKTLLFNHLHAHLTKNNQLL